MEDKSLNRFRKVAIIEGISTILLFFLAMPVKYGLDNEIMVKIIGPIHGILFLLYCALLIQVAMEFDWHWKKSLLGFIAAILPFGPFIGSNTL